jgi:prolyl 4-hydroxylase
MTVGTDSLEARARQGDIEALLELGVRYEGEAKIQAARGCYATAAKTGSVVGLRRLAISLLTQEPIEGEPGVNMMRAAADKGDAEAALVCANLAAGDTGLPDRWRVARECLEVAAERGAAFAAEQLAFAERVKLDFSDLARPERRVFDAPRISVIEGCASTAECDWLIERARPKLHRALVYDPDIGGGLQEMVRTNSSIAFSIAQSDVVLMLLRARIEAIAGPLRFEASSILHYAPGQEFKRHYDYFDRALPGHLRELETKGQRVATLLVYLNDDFEGGETEFPRLDWRYKGRKGDALLFWNVDPAGEPDPRTLHAGLPTSRGEKWLFSQWLRQDPR